jgi:protein gp37
MKNSNISWTGNTFNPWMGCTKVSPGCLHCYAATLMDTRYKRVKWGRGNPRKRTSGDNWKQPLKWNQQAVEGGIRTKVFCASLGDVFDGEVDDAWRDDLFTLIRNTPNLDWQLLTKRPENAVKYAAGIQWPDNAWIGTSIENQDWTGRALIITRIPAPVRFLSCEPLLGPVKLNLKGIDWVIVGGESGHGHRPMEKQWVIALRDQCRAAKVAFWFKQWGGRTPDAGGHLLDGVVHHEFPTPVRRRRVMPDAMALKAAT